MKRRGRRLAPDKFVIEKRLAALVYLAMKENGGRLSAARLTVAEYLGTSVDTVKRAWRDWGQGAQAPQNHGRAFAIELTLRLSPDKYAEAIDHLRRRLAEIRASRGVPASR